jgi:hypothetical protein
LREIRRRLRQEGRDSTQEDVIFRAYEQMRTIEDTAVNKTKEMRRNIERRNSRPAPAASGAPSASADDAAWWEEAIQPFREVVRKETSFVESTVNQLVSKRMVNRQQMQWTERGAHLLLQTRTRVLNGELEETFRRWYPKFRPEMEVMPVALKPAA